MGGGLNNKDNTSTSTSTNTNKNKRQIELEKKAIEAMKEGRDKYKDLIWNTKPPTTSEIKIIVKKFKKGKAPGPDGITTDMIKDLNWEALTAKKNVRNMVERTKGTRHDNTSKGSITIQERRPRKAGKLQTDQSTEHILQNNSRSNTKEASKHTRPPTDEDPIRLQEEQKYSRRTVCSKETARIRRSRTSRNDDTTRLGKGIR